MPKPPPHRAAAQRSVGAEAAHQISATAQKLAGKAAEFAFAMREGTLLSADEAFKLLDLLVTQIWNERTRAANALQQALHFAKGDRA